MTAMNGLFMFLPLHSAGRAHYASTLFGLAAIPLILLSVIIQISVHSDLA